MRVLYIDVARQHFRDGGVRHPRGDYRVNNVREYAGSILDGRAGRCASIARSRWNTRVSIAGYMNASRIVACEPESFDLDLVSTRITFTRIIT